MNLLEGMKSTIGRVHDENLVTGDEESRSRARADLRRQQRLHLAESSTWKRIDLADLQFERFVVRNTRTDETFRVYRGEVLDAMHSPIVAWAITPDGPVFLEPASR